MTHYNDLYEEFYEKILLNKDYTLSTCKLCGKECSKRVDTRDVSCNNSCLNKKCPLKQTNTL